MSRILLLDPDAAHRQWLRTSLEDVGVDVTDASGSIGPTANDLTDIDVVVANAELPSGPAIALCNRLPRRPLVLFTDDRSVPRAVEAMRGGASDYLITPLDPREVVNAINRCLERVAIPVDDRVQNPLPMVGHCPAMLALFEQIEAVAQHRSPLLILGEFGTGKELAARALHAASQRRARPLIALNCAAVPRALVESELFGHTSLDGQSRRGLVTAAEQSTLFLDEIDALTLEAQRRLLGLLVEYDTLGADSHGAQRNGDCAGVRLIAATHRDLRPLVVAGEFLEPLYARLNATTLFVPPLRERGDDVTDLSKRLLQRICLKLAKRSVVLSDAALTAIRRYHWPGNVRELENALERAVILCNGDVIDADLLAIDSTASKPHSPPSAEESDEQTSLEGYFVKFVLEHEDAFTETELANKLGISRKSLWERRQRLNIPRKRTRTRATRRDGDT